jgi:hypothetical protein
MRVALLVALCACSTAEEAPVVKVKELDAASFRAMLQCGGPALQNEPRCDGEIRNALRLIERVRVEPTGKGSARYLITMLSDATTRVVYAEYPGKILDEMTAAGVPYNVKPRD